MARALRMPGAPPAMWKPGLRSREAVVYAILRTAALIVVGIFLGLGASKRIHRGSQFVSSSNKGKPQLLVEQHPDKRVYSGRFLCGRSRFARFTRE